MITDELAWLIGLLTLIGVMVGAIVGVTVLLLGQYAMGLWSRSTQERRQWARKMREWAVTGRRESFRRVDLEGADLREVDLGPGQDSSIGADLSYSNLSNVNLESARLDHAILRGTTLEYANLERATLANADLRGSKLRGINLEYANLRNSNFTKAELEQANLRGADLTNANLRGANLTRTKLEYAILEGADLTGAELEGARYNDHTRWPSGFSPPSQSLEGGGNVEASGRLWRQ